MNKSNNIFKRDFFLMHLNDHIQYLRKIELTLEENTSLFQGIEYHQCKLGKWLYGAGASEISALENSSEAQKIFDDLFEPHKQFHVASYVAIKKQQLGDNEGAKEEITNMYKLSRIITKKLLQLDVLN